MALKSLFLEEADTGDRVHILLHIQRSLLDTGSGADLLYRKACSVDGLLPNWFRPKIRLDLIAAYTFDQGANLEINVPEAPSSPFLSSQTS